MRTRSPKRPRKLMAHAERHVTCPESPDSRTRSRTRSEPFGSGYFGEIQVGERSSEPRTLWNIREASEALGIPPSLTRAIQPLIASILVLLLPSLRNTHPLVSSQLLGPSIVYYDRRVLDSGEFFFFSFSEGRDLPLPHANSHQVWATSSPLFRPPMIRHGPSKTHPVSQLIIRKRSFPPPFSLLSTTPNMTSCGSYPLMCVLRR